MTGLSLLFGFTALLYAAVGFAGGSTYNALLVLNGTDYRILPLIALGCNLVVSTGGTIRFWRAGLVPFRRLWPMLLVSVPAAWIGGMLPVSKSLFLLFLGLSLLASGSLLLLQWTPPEDDVAPPARAGMWGPLLAGPIGLLSGLVGIGGGIFLAPLLHLLRWDRARRVAAAASVFILANTLSGLGGQLSKLESLEPALLDALQGYWPLGLAVLIGGYAGNRLAIGALAPVLIRRLTALIILYSAVRLLWQWFHGG